ncbi:MAG: hypothetical protein OXI24_17785 [Candidatus Poribacteria bacterium]|nr:hypothetical protein [Candidatus Poribacteria bacterium]
MYHTRAPHREQKAKTANKRPGPNTGAVVLRPDRIDRLGDLFASGIFAAVPNPTARLVLMANALVSGSDRNKNNYREHWRSDSSIAAMIGRSRQEVNRAQNNLKALRIVRRYPTPGRKTRTTKLVEFAALCEIAEQHGAYRRDIRPAPRNAANILHLPDAVLASGILKYLPDAAAELLLFLAWLVQAGPAAPDFGAYTIKVVEFEKSLHRSIVTIYTALKTLESAQLITWEGSTYTLQAHSAAQFKQAQTRIDTPAAARPFTAAAQARCRQARQKRKAVPTGIVDKKPEAVLTRRQSGPDISTQKPLSGPDTTFEAVPTRTTIGNHNSKPEPLVNHSGQMQEQRTESIENNSGLYAELDALCRIQDRDPTMTDYRRRTEIAQWIKRKTRPAADTQIIAAALMHHPPTTVLSDYMPELQVRSEPSSPTAEPPVPKASSPERAAQAGGTRKKAGFLAPLRGKAGPSWLSVRKALTDTSGTTPTDAQQLDDLSQWAERMEPLCDRFEHILKTGGNLAPPTFDLLSSLKLVPPLFKLAVRRITPQQAEAQIDKLFSLDSLLSPERSIQDYRTLALYTGDLCWRMLPASQRAGLKHPNEALSLPQ